MTAAEPSTEPTYGRYETLFRIASGGMAEVYAARARGEAGFEKLVALKRMLPHLSGDERFVTMFMDEARLAANIASPHVVSTLDLGRASDGSLYLVMELVVGVTLHALARNALRAGAPIPMPVAVELLAQAAQGLHDAHEACTPTGSSLQIVHRDVSPQNILVGVDGRARLTDFGIARATERSTQTSTGEFKGKLAYCSPEQCANEPLDRRADVFSLAIVGWEILTGERLFYAETPLAILEKVTRSEIREVSAVRPEIPRAISDVIARGLRRARDERFATAGELERALREAARATGNLAAPSAVAELVRAHGGEALSKIEQRLRVSMASPSPSAGALGAAPRASAPPPVPPPPPGPLHDAPTVVTPPPELVASHVTSHVAAPLDAPAPPAGRRAPLGIALLVVLLAAGIAGWLSMRGVGSDEAATSTAAAPPPVTAGADVVPTAASDTAEVDAPAEVPTSADAPAAPAEARPARERRGSRRARAEERRATARDERQPEASPPPTPRAATPTPPPTPPPARTTERTPERTAERTTERPATSPEPAGRPRGSGLLSIDAFERDLGSD